MVSDYSAQKQRGTALYICSTGIFFGYFAGGLIADIYGWRNAFFIVGITGVALAMLPLLLVQEPPRTALPDTIENENTTFNETIVFLLQRLVFWWVALGRSTAP